MKKKYDKFWEIVKRKILLELTILSGGNISGQVRTVSYPYFSVPSGK